MRTIFGTILLGLFFTNLAGVIMGNNPYTPYSQSYLAGFALGMLLLLGTACLLLLESKVSGESSDKLSSEEQNEDNICF